MQTQHFHNNTDRSSAEGTRNISDSPLFVEKTLENGLHILCHPDPRSPVVTVDVIYRVGSRYEPAGKTGYAHLFEHLMFDGSRHLGRGEYDRHCTLAGGENNAWTSCDLTNYWITLPAHRFELGLWLESDRMSGFGVQQISLDTQKGVVTAEKHQVIDNVPYGDAGILMRELMYAEGHPYRHEPIGSMQDVANATLDDMRWFYERYYIPSNATLVIAGGFDPQEALQLADMYFAEIPAGTHGTPPETADAMHRFGGRRSVSSDLVPFNGVFLGWHAPDLQTPDLMSLELLASILADGESSRFYLTMEYDPMIASETGAFLEEGERGSMFCVYAMGQTKRTSVKQLEGALREQVGRIARDGITGQELSKAKNRKISSVVHALQSVSNRAERMAYFAATHDDPSLAWKEAEAYGAITTDDIRRAAEQYLDPDKASVVEYRQ